MDIVEYNPANTIRHPWELVRFKFVSGLIKKHSPSDHKLRILDMGCGDCFFAASLLAGGFPATIIGIDTAYTKEEVQKKQAAIGHPDFFLFNNLEDAKQHLGSAVDLVLLLDVIEHIPNDVSFLKELFSHDFVNADTKCIITVPAYQRLFTSHDEFLRHYRRYTNRSLKKTLTDSGLQAKETGYFFFLLLPVRILQKWKEKLFGRPKRNHGLGGWKHGKFLTSIAKAFLMLDIAITRIFRKIGVRLPGLSNYCICKKPV